MWLFRETPAVLTLPLAKVIPIVNGLVHSVLADAPNPFLQVGRYFVEQKSVLIREHNMYASVKSLRLW